MKDYPIKKGNHYASMSVLEKITGLRLKSGDYSVKFRFSSSCYWSTPRNPDDHDLNKLTGIGFGLNHHNNSVRLAWVPDFEQSGVIKIFGYTYDNRQDAQKHQSAYITSVRTVQICSARIESLSGKYRITVEGVSIEMENKSPDPNIGFRLYPYFGGNNTAPQDMTISIDYL
jgi:hypothetical protein